MTATGGDLRELVGDDYSRRAYPEVFGELAAQGPITRVVVPGDFPVWVVTGYELGEAVLRDPRFTKDMSGLAHTGQALGTRRVPEDLTAVSGRHIANTEGADHSRLRRLLASHLSPTGMRRWEPEIGGIVREVLAAVEGRTGFDLRTDFADPVTERTVALVLGLPARLAPRVVGLARFLAGPAHPGQPAVVAAHVEFVRLLGEAVSETADTPGDESETVLAVLGRALRTGGISRREAVSYLAALLVGAALQVTMLAVGGALLIEDSAARAALLDGRAKEVVEELLRVHPPTAFSTWRCAAEPVDLAGARMLEGDAVLVLLAAANRDVSVCPSGGRIDLDSATRAPTLSFGGGWHYCIGAPMARLLAAVALPLLFRELPGLRLDCPFDRLRWTGTIGFRPPDHVPVSLPTGGAG